MFTENKVICIRSREHLLSTLAEASELEHNLMCLYLYAVFGMKESVEEGLSMDELSKVESWRKTIMDVAIQEMGHLAMVANLTTAIGGSAHFHRPTFPVRPGYYPSEFVVELAPFDMKTLEHFIFLERPEHISVKDSPEFETEDYEREAPMKRLMTHSGDYTTVGQLYDAIKEGIRYLSRTLGEGKLFCGAKSLQISPEDVKLEGLVQITDEKSALYALNTIVEQGEGGSAEDCHFKKFFRIKSEYEELLQLNPSFRPAREVVRNPVMRKPADPDGKVWIDHRTAIPVLDVANALYALMLRFLVQIYSMEGRSPEGKKILLSGAFCNMKALATVSKVLTKLPASGSHPDQRAGVSFSLDRYFNAYELKSEQMLLKERVEEIAQRLQEVSVHSDELGKVSKILEGISCSLDTKSLA